MLALPYGNADFRRLIKTGQVYVDRTAHIRDLEALGEPLLFIRPRRFGKSLWLRTLAAYYDVRTADEHDELFGALAIGRDPTPNAHRYFVLQWDFSEVSWEVGGARGCGGVPRRGREAVASLSHGSRRALW